MFALGGCKDFDEINVDPRAASSEQAQPEYFINNSIINAQFDPAIAEIIFILSWKMVTRQAGGVDSWGVDAGYYNDGWNGQYYGGTWGVKWLTEINTAVSLAEEKIATEQTKPYTENLLQVARIWRAYMYSEFADNFGPIPIDGFKGVAPSYASVENVYHFMLAELKDASTKLDLTVTDVSEIEKCDPAYGYDWEMWQKYANSLRLRLAMRLSEVDAAYAQAEFEDAADEPLLLTAEEMFAVQEGPAGAWTPLDPVNGRGGYRLAQGMAQNNIFVGLGGISPVDSAPADYGDISSYVKAADWAGVKYDERHLPTHTNDPMKGFWLDGLPATIDPRAFQIYDAPGLATGRGGGWYNADILDAGIKMIDPDQKVARPSDGEMVPDTVAVEHGTWFAWNGSYGGDVGVTSGNNPAEGANQHHFMPVVRQKFRDGSQKRVFFASWETNFLLAEGAVRGWTTPKSAQQAYEDGITDNFAYFGVDLGGYLTSEDYNRVGTSVSWTHTTEATGTPMRYKDGYTDTEMNDFTWTPPVNTIYKGGANNDALNKIITQKYIANNPYLPLESWSDHRRLGLPFFENPVAEQIIPMMPALTPENSMSGNQVAFFPQRLRYPSGLSISNPEGYGQAVTALGAGGDATLTPLWWAQH